MPSDIRGHRKELLRYVNRDELESLDQTVELTALLVGAILGITTYLSSLMQLTSLSVITQSFNVIATLTIWTSYKIARTKISIDLRLWVIVEGITLSYFILLQLFIQIPIFFLIEESIIRGALLVVYMILFFGLDYIRPYARKIAEKRWELLKGNIEPELEKRIDQEALYLVRGGRFSTSVYTFLAVALIWLATSMMSPSRFIYFFVFSFDIIVFSIGYILWKISGLQKCVWPDDEISR